MKTKQKAYLSGFFQQTTSCGIVHLAISNLMSHLYKPFLLQRSQKRAAYPRFPIRKPYTVFCHTTKTTTLTKPPSNNAQVTTIAQRTSDMLLCKKTFFPSFLLLKGSARERPVCYVLIFSERLQLPLTVHFVSGFCCLDYYSA